MKQNKEPLMRIAKRDGISRSKAYAIRIIAVLIAMMLFNNSKFRMNMIEKRNLKKSMNLQKEGE